VDQRLIRFVGLPDLISQAFAGSDSVTVGAHHLAFRDLLTKPFFARRIYEFRDQILFTPEMVEVHRFCWEALPAVRARNGFEPFHEDLAASDSTLAASP
jgi:hypothetical protein